MVDNTTLKKIANLANRSEKTSWNRKLKNMKKLLAKLSPIEEQMIELFQKKQPILDEVAELRATMVNECIHPSDQLVMKEDHVVCKFCGKRISLPK